MLKKLVALLFFFLFLLFSCDDSNPVDNVDNNDSTVTDIDDNVYNIIKIGDQVWTVENLCVEHYNDGTPIPNITENDEWLACTTGTEAYCYYENDKSNKQKYGVLYNWYAINTGKLAPEGWHVPTVNEWQKLRDYLIANGYNWDGTTSGNKIGKAMAAKTDWNVSDSVGNVGNDITSNNSSEYSALPGGFRELWGDFSDVGNNGRWWSATSENVWHAHFNFLNYNSDGPYSYYIDKVYGCSVRLLQD